MAKTETQQQIGYKKTMQESRLLLKQIAEKLKALDKEQVKHPGNWGYNGTAGMIRERLKEINDSFKYLG